MSQQNLKNWKFASETMAAVLDRFSFATAAEKQFKQRKHCKKITTFWLSVWKKWCLEKGIGKEIENYEPTQLNNLLERSDAEIKNKHS